MNADADYYAPKDRKKCVQPLLSIRWVCSCLWDHSGASWWDRGMQLTLIQRSGGGQATRGHRNVSHLHRTLQVKLRIFCQLVKNLWYWIRDNREMHILVDFLFSSGTRLECKRKTTNLINLKFSPDAFDFKHCACVRGSPRRQPTD